MSNVFDSYLNEASFNMGSTTLAASSTSMGLNMKVAYGKYLKFSKDKVEMDQFWNHPEVQKLAKLVKQFRYELVSVPFIPLNKGFIEEPPFIIIQPTYAMTEASVPKVQMRPKNWDLPWKGKYLSFMMVLDWTGELNIDGSYLYSKAIQDAYGCIKALNGYDFSKLPRKKYGDMSMLSDPGI